MKKIFTIFMLLFLTLMFRTAMAQVTRSAGTEADFNTAYASSATNDIISLTANIVITSAKALNKTITINGNYFTITVPRPGLDDMGKYNTTPSTFNVFNISGSVIVIINHLTIKGGNVTTSGGAITVASGSTLHLNYCTLSNSKVIGTSSGGGAIWNSGVTYLNSTLVTRNAATAGGGFLNKPASAIMYVENSTFSKNRTTSTNGDGGAGQNYATMYMNNSTIANNQCTEIGGGISINSTGTIYLANCSVTGNVSYYFGFYSGAISNNNGSVYAVNTLFAYNYHSSSGTVTNPTGFALDDVQSYQGQANVHLYYCIYHASLPYGTDDAIGNINYTGLADGSDNSIFSGGILSKITDNTGVEIGTAYVFRPLLYNNNGIVAPTLKAGGFPLLTANRGTQTRFANNNNVSPAIAYYNKTTSAWVDMIGTSTSDQLVTTDQVSVSRANPSTIGAIVGITSNLYMVKINSATNGSVNGGTIYGDVYPAGTSVTVTAIPNTGYSFVRWDYVIGGSGTASTSNPYTFTVNNDITLVPVFAVAVGFNITYVGNENTGGTAPATANYTSLPDTIANHGSLGKDGYIFIGWNTNSNGSGTSYAEGASYNTNANLTLYAQWLYSVANPTSIDASANPIWNGSNTTLTCNGAVGTVYWFTGSCGGTQVATGNTYQVSPSSNTTYYARNYNNSVFSASCASITINVNSFTTISSQSTASQTKCLNGTFTPITVTATGTNLVYQWYSNTTADTTGGSTVGTDSIYTPSAATSGTLYYYCKVSGDFGTPQISAVSGAFIVNTIPVKPTNTTPTANQTIISGNAASLSVSGTGTLGWYSAASGGIWLGSGSNYTSPVLTSNTTYYVQDSTSCGASTTRTAIAVQIQCFVTIPDSNFKAALLAIPGLDANHDGQIQCSEAAAWTGTIDVSNKGISNLTGIEAFTKITYLLCQNNSLTSLNVSSNTALIWLYCYRNSLTSLDVSHNTFLTTLDCSVNSLTSLDIHLNTALYYLQCNQNSLTSLDVHLNTALYHLNCSVNSLISLNVHSNTALNHLFLSSNSLTSLDVTINTALTYLSCDHNLITSLDVTHNTLLTSLQCNQNSLTSLDVHLNTALTSLGCDHNSLTSLVVTTNTALTYLACDHNLLTSLDVHLNTALTMLFCSNNSLTSLDVHLDTALTSLECINNSLTSLNVKNGNNINIVYFIATGNASLTCIQVDNAAWAAIYLRYGVSAFTSFSTNCSCLNPIISSQSTATQTQCLNGTFNPISVIATGTNLVYQWYKNTTADTTGGTIVSTDSVYTPSASISGTLYYYCKVSGECGTVQTTTMSGAFITQAIFTPGAILSTGETICENSNPSEIGNVTASSGGDGTITYIWQANGTDISESDAATYNPPTSLTSTITYTRFAKDNTCNTSFTQSTGSWIETVNPLPIPTISGLATSKIISSESFENNGNIPDGWATETVVFDVEGDGDAGTITFVTSTSIPEGYTASDGAYFVMFNSYTASYGNVNRLKKTGPISTIGLANASVNFAWLESSDIPDYPDDKVEVEYSTDNTTWTSAGTYYRYNADFTGWKNISQVLPAATLGQATLYIAFKFTSDWGNDCYLDLATISTNVIDTICVGNTSTCSTEAGMTGYAWATSTGGTIISGVGTNVVNVLWNTAGEQTLSVNYIDTNSCNALSATVGKIIINPATVITSQSTAAQTQCINGTFTSISITATGTGTLSYQWYKNATASTSGGTTVGTNSNSYTPSATVAGTLYYYCIVTSTCGTATSAVSGAFIVNPNPTPVITGPNVVIHGGTYTYCTPLTIGNVYYWSGFGVVTFPNTNHNCIDDTFSSPCGAYTPWTITVVETVPNTGCTATATMNITIN